MRVEGLGVEGGNEGMGGVGLCRKIINMGSHICIQNSKINYKD
jgi:hypothetical protein